MRVLVIASAEYVVSELAAEFGRIPPAFLPLGNRRLFEWQLDALQDRYGRVILTLPIDFPLSRVDQERLDARGVVARRTPPGIPFLASLRQVLDDSPTPFALDVLYGDTLASPPAEPESDWYLIGSTTNYYQWHFADRAGQDRYMVWAGMFSFSDGGALRALLDEAPSFDAAVERYGETCQLKPAVAPDWLDFGHVHTYYVSKRTATTQRHFNELSITKNVVTKRSADRVKIAAGAHGFRELPPILAPFAPSYAGEVRDSAGIAGYATEYLALPTLSELLVFGRLPSVAWAPIFSAIDEFLETAASLGGVQPETASWQEQQRLLYLSKTIDRLQQYADEPGAVPIDQPLSLNGAACPSLLAIAQECAEAVLANPGRYSPVVHGDLCFSNILFDFRTSRVKVIDPRGLNHDKQLVCGGDIRYEVGKLAHSVVGAYDFIVADCIRARLEDGTSLVCDFSSGTHRDLVQLFLKSDFNGRTPSEWDVYPIMVLLFLSMLPLHADRPVRQLAFVANAIRLYQEWPR